MLIKEQIPESGMGADSHSYLKVTIIYADIASNKMASEVCDSLKQKLGPVFHVEESSWKLELLRNEKLRAFAADEAMQSDIVIIAARESISVPEEIESWFQLWQDQRHGAPAALIALLDGRKVINTDENKLKAWLARKASDAGMEFFCHVEMQQPIQLDESFEDLDTPIMLDNDIQTMDIHPRRFSI